MEPYLNSHDAELPFASRANVMLLHQPLHTLPAHANATLTQLPPDARPPIGSAILPKRSGA